MKEDADNAYKSAIKRNDMQAVQRMVDKAAKEAGYTENQIKSGKNFVLYNEKRSNAFLQTYGYMASVGEGIKPSDKTISQSNGFVNTLMKILIRIAK